MTLEQSKDNLLKEVKTPNGIHILYGINLLPNDSKFESDGFGLIFYINNSQVIFFNIDCEEINN